MKTQILNSMQKILKAWDQFWFQSQNLLGLACMRIFLCGTLFSLYVVRSFNLEYYTPDAWITKSQALDVMHELYRPLFLWGFWPDSWNPFAHLILVLSLGLLTLGVGGRSLMFLAWVLNASFIQRNYSVNFGADIIANLFLFHLMFTKACSRLSVISFIKKGRTVLTDGGMASSVFFRLIQVQICVIYAYTGFEKLRGASWWDGTALWSVLANPQMTTFDLSFLRHLPWIIPILSFTTILFEIYFPVLVAWRKTRYWILGIGVFFHIGIGLFLGLEAFAFTMLSAYFLFLSPELLERRLFKKPSQA